MDADQVDPDHVVEELQRLVHGGQVVQAEMSCVEDEGVDHQPGRVEFGEAVGDRLGRAEVEPDRPSGQPVPERGGSRGGLVDATGV